MAYWANENSHENKPRAIMDLLVNVPGFCENASGQNKGKTHAEDLTNYSLLSRYYDQLNDRIMLNLLTNFFIKYILCLS